nr:phosphatidylinositol 3,4,5-trisphosphate 3-phosphatase and dual-specificity protein phosphatase PTEN [Hydra vulgaris]
MLTELLVEVVLLFTACESGIVIDNKICSEKYYEPEKFSSRVSVFGFKDHCAPPFELIEQSCVDMDNWLTKDVENVAIVHCKDGKGRTGTMICAYLLYKGFYDNAKDAMDYYAVSRTENKKGVTIPSQKRYIEYFSYYLKHIKNQPGIGFDRKTVFLKSFTFIGIPTFTYGTCVPSFVVFSGEVELYKSKTFEIKKSEKEYTMHLKNPLPLCGDIKVDFFHKDLFKKERMFVFWFNTTFLEHDITQTLPITSDKNDNVKRILFSKNELDKANKDKKHKFFPENFKLSINIALPENGKEDNDKGCNNKEKKKCDDKLKSKNEKLNSSSTDKLNELSDTRKVSPTSPENFSRTLSPSSTKRESSSLNKGDSLTRSLSPSLDAVTVDDAPTVEGEQLSDDDEEEEEQERMFVFGFDTTFLEYDITSIPKITSNKNDNVKRILFNKNELDKASKDKKHKFFPENFKLSINIPLPENGKEDNDKGCNNKEKKKCDDKLKSENENLNSSSTDKLNKFSDTRKVLPTSPENFSRTLSPPSKKREIPVSNKDDSLNRPLSASLDALTVDDAPTADDAPIVEEEQLSDDDEDDEQVTEI